MRDALDRYRRSIPLHDEYGVRPLPRQWPSGPLIGAGVVVLGALWGWIWFVVWLVHLVTKE